MEILQAHSSMCEPFAERLSVEFKTARVVHLLIMIMLSPACRCERPELYVYMAMIEIDK